LFHRAAESDPAGRASLLDAVCSADPELRREVEALLFCDRDAGQSFLAAVHSGLDAVGFPLTGETISHYRILEGLGGGGMGSVYRAEDIMLGRQIALKFLPEESVKNPASLGRFEREARSASALEHPNICPIYEFGEHEGQPFLAMQLLEGQTLRERIDAAESGTPPFELADLLNLAIQIVDGLDAAHRHGIIHRDIKPANIFVTSQGQAKILDFGLAKPVPVMTVVGNDSEPDNHHNVAVDGTAPEVELRGTPDLFLSHTGVAMGTAGYMSPEQARGEKLDARTDLFSFGLVLYEMATGERAFKGDTGPSLHDAILKQMPAPARELNPKLPAKLEKIIAKALEKDRDLRYRTASEMRTELGTLTQTRHSYRWGAAVAAVLFLVLAAVAYFGIREPRRVSRQTALELKYRQITTNPPENRVINGAISPDGKYLVYSDQKGMHIRELDTGETRSVPQPAAFDGTNLDWEIAGIWLADGTRFLAEAHELGEASGNWSIDKASIWVGSVLGGPPKKLRDQATAYGISPDRSQISFGTKDEHEIWLMRPDGENAHKFFESEAKHHVCCLGWSPDGQRILYLDFDAAEDARMVSRDLNGGPLTTLVPPSEMNDLGEIVWTRDGRMIYSVGESGTLAETCNYWIRRFDLRTGATLEEPRRLTNWTGFCPSHGTLTADEKSLAFLGWAKQLTAFAADLEAGGTRLRNSRRLTLDESNNNPLDWTPDSKAVIFFSNRSGHEGIYKQALDSDTPELLTSSSPGFNAARVSPDGKWIISHLLPKTKGEPVQLVRVPLKGGFPELIFPLRGVGEVSCAKSPSNLCTIAERSVDRKQVTVMSFDPLKGRGPELLRFNVDPKLDWGWHCDLSPDGIRLAVVASPNQPIQILSLRGQPPRFIPVKGTMNYQYVYWSADGKGLFVTHGVKGGSELVHMDLQGNMKALWKNNGGYYPWGLQSPDGRHLAIQGSVFSSNMWIMENF
jgi:serine/threonine protein kinase/Tol biopolymer transport system component